MIALIFIYIAGMLNWVYDMSLLKPELLPDKFNPENTWRNKWKMYYLKHIPCCQVYKYVKPHWWYFGLYKPQYEERFLYSSTLLVFLTDWFHAIQMLQRVMWVTGFAIAAVSPTPDWSTFWVILFYIKISALAYGAGFHSSRIINKWLRNQKR
jgi:hypothetical protein